MTSPDTTCNTLMAMPRQSSQMIGFMLLVMVLSCFSFSGVFAQEYDDQYARDRAEIEDLQARYLFAFDWQDGEAYASTFTEDGILDFAGGVIKGRAAIQEEIETFGIMLDKRNAALLPERPARLRHYISNVIIKVEGDTAKSRSYWWEFNNDQRDRTPYVGAYGHYEDDLKKVNGQWLFSKRKIYNERRAEMASGDESPGW